MSNVGAFLRGPQHNFLASQRGGTSRSNKLCKHSIRIETMYSSLPPCRLEVLFGVSLLAGSTVKFPECTLDDCRASCVSHVIICRFAVILLQTPEATDIERLQEMCCMGGKTEEFNIIVNGILTKFEVDV